MATPPWSEKTKTIKSFLKMKEVTVTYEGITQSPQEYLKGVDMRNTLGKREAEELLSKILGYSLEQNRWVAVSLVALGELLDSDAALVDVACERNLERQKEYEAKVAERASHCWLRRLFLEKIPEPKYEEVQYTSLTIRRNAPIKAFEYMQERGLIECFQENNEWFVKATLKALQTIKKWRRPHPSSKNQP